MSFKTPVPATITAITEWQTLGETIIAQCLKLGASAAELVVGHSKGFDVNIREGDVDTLSFNRDTGLSLTVYRGQQTGSVSLGDLRPEEIEQAIQKALKIAEYTGQDPFAGLADAALMAKNYPDLGLYHPWGLTPEEAIEQAKKIEEEALSYDNRLKGSDGVSIATHEGIHVYANSQGFSGAYPRTSHVVNCQLIGESHGQMQSEGEYTVARDPQDLMNLSLLAKTAAEKTVKRLGGRSLATGHYPVVFHAPVAKSLVGHLMQAISGGAIYRRASFLVDHFNQPVAASRVTLTEHPHLYKGIASAPFDDEGVFTRTQTFIEAGQLQSYLLSTYSGRQLQLPTTGNAGGVRNLILNDDGYDLNALLQAMGTGLFVTAVMGQGVNIVTGDYSRGASGFWVEKGELVYPVEEITIASHLKDMWMNLHLIGNDRDSRSSIQTGSLFIDSMMVAGRAG